MTAEAELERGISVVSVPERVDLSNTREFILPMQKQIAEGQLRFVLDFSSTEAMDSTALGALVQLYKSLSQRGGAVALVCVGDAVRRVLSITRLDTVFTLCGSRAEAIGLLDDSRS